jgi:hypothetical protein
LKNIIAGTQLVKTNNLKEKTLTADLDGMCGFNLEKTRLVTIVADVDEMWEKLMLMFEAGT